MNGESPVSLYIHIPFCQKRCAYCDFNTYAGVENLLPAFVEALCIEIAQVANGLASENQPTRPIQTIFFGGGTPSLLSNDHFRQIFNELHARFTITKDAEISLEANPGTVTDGYFEGLREVGFNRISFGVQSADASMLKFLDRIHTFDDVRRSVGLARRAGFENFNLDLIFGIPGQSLKTWRESLVAVLDLQPPHISAYALGIEQGTPLEKWYRKGLIEPVNDDLAADQFNLASEILAAYGYGHYEISNWCKPGHECRHNLAYWRNQDYLGLGPGAHGHYKGLRYADVLAIPQYIRQLKQAKPNGLPVPCSAAVANHRVNDVEEVLEDKMMCGLRLLDEGVNIPEIEREFAIDFRQHYKRQLRKLTAQGLVEISDDRLRLSAQGVLLGNRVFHEFIDID